MPWKQRCGTSLLSATDLIDARTCADRRGTVRPALRVDRARAVRSLADRIERATPDGSPRTHGAAIPLLPWRRHSTDRGTFSIRGHAGRGPARPTSPRGVFGD